MTPTVTQDPPQYPNSGRRLRDYNASLSFTDDEAVSTRTIRQGTIFQLRVEIETTRNYERQSVFHLNYSRVFEVYEGDLVMNATFGPEPTVRYVTFVAKELGDGLIQLQVGNDLYDWVFITVERK